MLALAEIARHNLRNQTDIGMVATGAVSSLVALLLYSKSAQIEAQCHYAILSLAVRPTVLTVPTPPLIGSAPQVSPTPPALHAAWRACRR